MINAVEVTNSIGESLLLELFYPEKTGIAVGPITGLGTPQFTVNTIPYGIGDGSAVGTVRADYRNIVFKFWPLFNPLVEDSRQLLYRYFQVKKPITLTFHLDNRTVDIDGYVESNDPDIFTNPESISISVICPDPYFRDRDPDKTYFYGSAPMFEFPFSNPVNYKTLIMSELSIDNRATIEYKPEIATGMEIEIRLESVTGDIALYNVGTEEKLLIYNDKIERFTGKPLDKGDQIFVNTVLGSRTIELYREGHRYNILGAVNRDLDWFQLEQGPNVFTYTTAEEHAFVFITFTYQNKYASI